MLQQTGPGGIILLATDGANSPGLTNVVDVLSTVIQAGIRVITIAIG